MKLWALRLALFVVAVVPMMFWGIVFAPGLLYVMPLIASVAAVMIVRRFEHWLVEQDEPPLSRAPQPKSEPKQEQRRAP